MSNIIRVISNRIEDRGMSITVVATRANINPELLSRTLNGRRKLKADELVDLCRVLDLGFSGQSVRPFLLLARCSVFV